MASFQPPSLLSPTSTVVGAFGGSEPLAPPFGGLPPAAGAFASGYQVCTVVWKVNTGANTDGADISGGLFDFCGICVFSDTAFNSIGDQVLFCSATVNIPEPGTVSPLGLGLLARLQLSRRSRA